jgi:hypothetical protein
MGVEAREPDHAFAPDTPCDLCGTEYQEHASRMHKFVGPGMDAGAAVNPPNKTKKPQEQSKTTLIVSPAPDIVLRQLLLEKGLIEPGQLEAKERELTIGTVGIRPGGYSADFFVEPPANT